MQVNNVLATMALIDEDWDLTIPHLIVATIGALVALWVMMCTTRHARFRTANGRWTYVLRLWMGSLAIVFLARVAWTIYFDSRPAVLDVAFETVVVFILLSLPLALPPVRIAARRPPFGFAEGQHVVKRAGDYTFTGIVLSAFRKRSGVPRYAVENDEGLVHIFNDGQLEADGDRT